jgi:ribonuclease P protein component
MEQNNQADSAVNIDAPSHGYRLYKKEKLCSVIAIEQLFGGGGADCHAALAYPLRAVWRENARRSSDAPVQFLISIPKKKLRHAVDRVQMRRRVREAYRLNHHSYPLEDGHKVDVAFIYVAKNLESYQKVESAMHRLLKKISGK